MDNLPTPQTSLRKSIILKEGPVVQRKRDKKNTLFIFQKKNITVLLVIIHPLLAEKRKKIMITFKENF